MKVLLPFNKENEAAYSRTRKTTAEIKPIQTRAIKEVEKVLEHLLKVAGTVQDLLINKEHIEKVNQQKAHCVYFG